MLVWRRRNLLGEKRCVFGGDDGGKWDPCGAKAMELSERERTTKKAAAAVRIPGALTNADADVGKRRRS